MLMKNNKQKGFSFVEVIMAVAIFSVIMVVATNIFAKTSKSYHNARAIQINLENAQQVINIMAKTLRTSNVSSPAGKSASIDFYNYSQGECITYSFAGNELSYGSAISDSRENCVFPLATPLKLISESNSFIKDGFFDIKPSVSGVVGRVTISMELCPSGGCDLSIKDSARVQTTVSSRNYEELIP